MDTEKLDKLIVSLKKRLDDAQKVKQILANNPEVASVLSELNGQVPPTNKQKPRKRRGAERRHLADKYFEKISTFLGDSWKSTQDIQEGIGLSKNKVSHVLYNSHPDRFEKRRNSENARITEWHLKPVSKE